MAEQTEPTPLTDKLGESQVAELDANLGKASLRVRVAVTPRGLLAIGALVSGILISTTALVWVATSGVRRHPIAARLPLR